MAHHAYKTSKHLTAMYEKWGVLEGRTCNNCIHLRNSRCHLSSMNSNHWNRNWQACGRWVRDSEVDGYEWVKTPDGWTLRYKGGK